jgi:hypothetical protein
MKILGLIILVFLLALLQTTTKAQTANSAPESKYYSPQVKEKLAAGAHPAPANPSQHLPGDHALPEKAIALGKNAHVSTGNDSNSKLPGSAPVNIEEVRLRNEKWINKETP